MENNNDIVNRIAENRKKLLSVNRVIEILTDPDKKMVRVSAKIHGRLNEDGFPFGADCTIEDPILVLRAVEVEKSLLQGKIHDDTQEIKIEVDMFDLLELYAETHDLNVKNLFIKNLIPEQITDGK